MAAVLRELHMDYSDWEDGMDYIYDNGIGEWLRWCDEEEVQEGSCTFSEYVLSVPDSEKRYIHWNRSVRNESLDLFLYTANQLPSV